MEAETERNSKKMIVNPNTRFGKGSVTYHDYTLHK